MASHVSIVGKAEWGKNIMYVAEEWLVLIKRNKRSLDDYKRRTTQYIFPPTNHFIFEPLNIYFCKNCLSKERSINKVIESCQLYCFLCKVFCLWVNFFMECTHM